MSEERPDRRGIGDNNPPPGPYDHIDPHNLVDVKAIVPVLNLNFQPLIDRREECIAGIGRWIEAHTPNFTGGTAQIKPPPRIEDDQDCADAQDYLQQLRDFSSKEVEPARKKVKVSIDKAAKAIQGWFVGGLSDAVVTAKQPIEDAYTAYLVAKEDRIRKARAAAAMEQAAQARRLADQASRARSAKQKDVLTEQAIVAEEYSGRLFAEAEAPTRELTRIYGDEGSVGGLRSDWKWREENLIELIQAVAHGQEPASMLTTNDVYINSLVRPKDGRRKIPGLIIFEEKTGR